MDEIDRLIESEERKAYLGKVNGVDHFYCFKSDQVWRYEGGIPVTVASFAEPSRSSLYDLSPLALRDTELLPERLPLSMRGVVRSNRVA